MNKFDNPDDAIILQLLQRCRRLAVVGLSARENRPSHGVAAAMQGYGYQLQPVNPGYRQLLGETCVEDLGALHPSPDIVDVFRAPEHVASIVDRCIELNLPALWLQEGVIDARAAARAQQSGIVVVMDRCIYKEYQRLRPFADC